MWRVEDDRLFDENGRLLGLLQSTAPQTLIAAAPDMLAALKGFVAEYGGDRYERGLWPLMDEARAAIAKAEVRS